MNDFSPTLFEDTHFAILGLGTHGIEAARRLLRCGAVLQIYDDNQQTRDRACRALHACQQFPQQLVCQPFHHIQQNEFAGLIPSPGIAHTHPFIKEFIRAGIPLFCDTEILQMALSRSKIPAKFIGITGTNGKSTTTTLIGHLFKEAGYCVAIGGNLGPSSLSLPLLERNGIYVIEMSSYMLEMVHQLHFDCACLLNITPDHLERHLTMAHYSQAKSRIFQNQSLKDASVIGIDDHYCTQIKQSIQEKHHEIITISGANEDADYYGISSPQPAIIHKEQRFLLKNKRLHGTFNRQNAAAAIAIARHFGISHQSIEDGLNSYQGLPHRQDPFFTHNNIHFIDDSKATNGASTVQAIKEYPSIVWIGGGLCKADGIEPLISYLAHIQHAFIFGRDRQRIARTLAAHHVHYTTAPTLDELIAQACQYARNHNVPVVLFSPACASFDQYKSFAHRGEHFKELIHRYYSSPLIRPATHANS